MQTHTFHRTSMSGSCRPACCADADVKHHSWIFLVYCVTVHHGNIIWLVVQMCKVGVAKCLDLVSLGSPGTWPMFVVHAFDLGKANKLQKLENCWNMIGILGPNAFKNGKSFNFHTFCQASTEPWLHESQLKSWAESFIAHLHCWRLRLGTTSMDIRWPGHRPHVLGRWVQWWNPQVRKKRRPSCWRQKWSRRSQHRSSWRSWRRRWMKRFLMSSISLWHTTRWQPGNERISWKQIRRRTPFWASSMTDS